MQFIASLAVALALTFTAVLAVEAEDVPETLDEMFAELQSATDEDAKRIESRIWAEWSQSGSAAMDLLLQRGRDATDAGDYVTAIAHLTALTDHAPDFAEGWNARATALFYASRYGEAVNDIAHVLALNPRHFGAMTGLAMIYEAMDKPKEALRVLREVERLNPHQEGLEQQIRYLERAAGEAVL